MSVERIPEAVDALLRECVYTFDELEVLLLLQPDPARQWSAADLGAAIKLKVDDTTAVADALVERRLLTRHGDARQPRYSLGGDRPNVTEAVNALAAVARDSRLTIIRVMNANAVERLRNKAARAFSDAFLMRNKNDHG